MLARLVVLPEPVGPVTRIKPRGRTMSRLIASGMPTCSKDRNWLGNAPQHHADVAALLENRDAEADAVEVLDGEVGAAFFLQFLLAAVGRDALHQPVVSSLSRTFGVQARADGLDAAARAAGPP